VLFVQSKRAASHLILIVFRKANGQPEGKISYAQQTKKLAKKQQNINEARQVHNRGNCLQQTRHLMMMINDDNDKGNDDDGSPVKQHFWTESSEMFQCHI